MDNRHVVAIAVCWSSNGDTHHAELASNALQRLHTYLHGNKNCAKIDDSIVGCFCESQIISDIFKKG
jgi:hypothetical protein